jgi:ribosomal protein L37AE/L43A
MRMKPKCPNCNTKRNINTMTKFWSNTWYLCSNCKWNNFGLEDDKNG